MTYRRWIAERWDEQSATIVGADAEHLARVLRAQPGMEADVVAGGRVFHSQVAAVSVGGENSEVRFLLVAELESDPALPVTLVLAVYKFDRMEWAIEKATELGVAAIVPVIARRTEKHLAQAAAKRVERWRRIAHEAAQQARRSDVPEVSAPIALAERVCAASTSTRIVLAEQERSTTLRHAVDDAVNTTKGGTTKDGTKRGTRRRGRNRALPVLEIAIGPEGGWAPDEAALFDANGWRAASLGPRIVRAETAAIVALAVIASALE